MSKGAYKPLKALRLASSNVPLRFLDVRLQEHTLHQVVEPDQTVGQVEAAGHLGETNPTFKTRDSIRDKLADRPQPVEVDADLLTSSGEGHEVLKEASKLDGTSP